MKKKMIYDIANRNREVSRTGNNDHDEKEIRFKREKLERRVQSIIRYARVIEQDETNELE